MADRKGSATTISKKLKRKQEKDVVKPGSSETKLSKLVAHRPVVNIERRLLEIRKMEKSNPVASKILEIETNFTNDLMQLSFGKQITHIYNPVDYAYKPHFEYYRKFCKNTVEVLLIGENPGPFGGAQNGIPFGNMKTVTDWLKINEEVASPEYQHEKRPILGFETTRTEGSGSRLWGFIQQYFDTADEFFDRCFIYNYCPLVFMNQTGANITPSSMQMLVKKPLLEICDENLAKIIQLFPNCRKIVSIGRFTERRVKEICSLHDLPHQQFYLLHPSPRSPAATLNWETSALATFKEFGLIL